ncbi:hypothetical protein FD733_00610 [Pantoea sp. Eser]|nr:hypothetical protein [Pantoea sp. Eser]
MTRVNLITGFLGSGKTTLLCHLLAAKPANEQWAVLVNEFGEIGVDGALLADPRVVANENFRDQLAAAEIIIGNKQDRWRRALNQGQGYSACGWLFDAATQFDQQALLEWVRHAPGDRIKGVMHIETGSLMINRQGDDLQIETRSQPPADSRIEIIDSQQADWNSLQSALLKCRLR